MQWLQVQEHQLEHMMRTSTFFEMCLGAFVEMQLQITFRYWCFNIVLFYLEKHTKKNWGEKLRTTCSWKAFSVSADLQFFPYKISNLSTSMILLVPSTQKMNGA